MEKDLTNIQNEGIKVLFLGESGVGKTNIINILMGEKFNEEEATTTTGYFSVKKILLENNFHILHLWQAISQEKFRELTKLFYTDSKIVIFVYEITSKESFGELNYWIKSVEEKIGPDFVRGIIANKMDLYENERVSPDEGEEFAKSKNAKFLEFSAKSEGPKKLEIFLTELLKEYLEKENEKENKNNDKIILNEAKKKKKNNCAK